MTLAPIPPILAYECNKKCREERKKKVPPLKTPKASEVQYRRALNQVVKALKIHTRDFVIPMLRNLESQYVTDSDSYIADNYAEQLASMFEVFRRSFSNVEMIAKQIANSFVYQTSQMNKNRFYKSIENAIGVDINSIIQKENLENVLIATVQENVNLIRSIPEQYFKNIESIVYVGTTQGRNASSMIQEIQKQGNVTERRARLIARDQNAKLNSAITQQRQLNLGITEYIWRTSEDERVRPSHKSKNGKIFKWSEPPKDTGHPGQDIQCRCIAQPIINL